MLQYPGTNPIPTNQLSLEITRTSQDIMDSKKASGQIIDTSMNIQDELNYIDSLPEDDPKKINFKIKSRHDNSILLACEDKRNSTLKNSQDST